MCSKNNCSYFIMLSNSSYSNVLPNSVYSIRKNAHPCMSTKSFNKYSKDLDDREKGSLFAPGKFPPKLFKIVNNGKMKSGPSVLLKKSKYKWENKNSGTTVSPITLGDSTRWYNKPDGERMPRSICANEVIENSTINHYRSSIPFNSVVTKGWFCRKVCGIRCVNEMPLDLQSCCFISERFVPENTLNMKKLLKTDAENLRSNVKKNDIENRNSFVALSKHKLIRKEFRSTPKIQEPKTNCPLVLNTRRKLIRKSKSNPTEPDIPIPSAESAELVIPLNIDSKQSNAAAMLPDLSPKKKHTCSSSYLQHRSSLVVLTKRKLVRRQAAPSHSDVSVTRKKSSKSITVESPGKLISVNRNKLIRSSLLRKTVKPSRSINSHPANSVLYHMIQHRRRPYPGSSYALLTRNKLIRRVKFRHKVWKKQTGLPNKEIRPAKKIMRSPKTFVSVGNNKLIRKSLFTKCNKTEGQKTAGQLASPFQKMMLARVLNSPCKRIQRFTNHLSRMNLKYVSERATSVVRNKFKNRCKNNRRTLRRKKSEIICPAFRKRGECSKFAKKCCSMLHDKKFISLCKNKLKGACEETNCLLSHDVIPEKVPICLHYLSESCTVDNCAYLHVKPDLTAPICVQFLRGYCDSADKCPNWHLYACQEYKDSSTCSKGDNCRLPHRSIDYFKGRAVSITDDEEDTMGWRYFEKNKLTNDDLACISVIPQREQMGTLPEFIPL